MMTTSALHTSSRDNRGRPLSHAFERGLSLVELMVAMAIGLMLVAGISTLIAQQSGTNRELSNTSRLIENGRYAMQVLRDDIELAGYYGEYYNLALDFDPATASTALPDPCATDIPSIDAALPTAIQGYDAPSSVPSPLSACLASANHLPGTDILVVRRTDTTPIPVASATAGAVYLQAGLNPSSAFVRQLGSGSDSSVFTLTERNGTSAALRRFLVHIYYISPCNIPATGSTCSGASDDSGNPIPTLKRMELSVAANTPAFTVTPLVEGIENIQLDYGMDTTGDGAPDYTTSGTFGADGSTILTGTDWWNVMTVRVNLLARNPEPTGGRTDTKLYNLGKAGSIGPFNDAYKRHVFSETMRAVNPSGRRAR